MPNVVYKGAWSLTFRKGRMTAFLKLQSRLLRSRKAQLALAFRVTIGAAGAYAIATAIHLRLPLWAVLTSLIVTQMSVGRSHSGEAGLVALLVLAVAPLAFIAAINPSLNAATVTAVIVLLVPTMSHVDPLASAIDRVMEVTVGALTGLLVTFFVLPSRAHGQIRITAARTLGLIAAAFSKLLAGLTHGLDKDDLHQIQDGIGQALVELNALGAEAERERAAHLSKGPDTGPLLRTNLRLRHDLVMIGRACVMALPPDLQARLAAPLAQVNDAVVVYLRSTAAALRTGAGSPPTSPLDVALQGYAAEVAALRSEGLIRGLPGDVAEHFFALGFALEQMRQNLQDLGRCVLEWSEPPR